MLEIQTCLESVSADQTKEKLTQSDDEERLESLVFMLDIQSGGVRQLQLSFSPRMDGQNPEQLLEEKNNEAVSHLNGGSVDPKQNKPQARSNHQRRSKQSHLNPMLLDVQRVERQYPSETDSSQGISHNSGP
ncbi:hypothetical protein WICPIJ_002925 [Wickerhamomyces pijperi]|uniref:Uncharacterized protein n=1 Tax=Wickerhamomyces pijperi TaxID=599730 RepID=A0A9P8TNG9_WICPI|nr:hypothetical protein WICPIJ_002925 [Wickerhamomyces pijperi]